MCGEGAAAQVCGGERRAAIFGHFEPPGAGRTVAALSHGGGRNGRGPGPRSSPYLVRQASHWPAGQRRSRPVRAETPAGRLGTRGRGVPAGAAAASQRRAREGGAVIFVFCNPAVRGLAQGPAFWPPWMGGSARVGVSSRCEDSV